MKTKSKDTKPSGGSIHAFSVDYEQPTAVERVTRKWVTFETEDGTDYNDFLIYLFNNSSVNNAIINGVSAMIYGEGLTYDGSPNEVATANKLFRAEDIRKVSGDFKLFNKYAFQVQWNKVPGHEAVAKVRHIAVNNVRIAEDGGYWYSDRWDLSRKPQYKPKYFKPFGDADKTETQILFYQPYFPGNQFYSLPDYSGSLSWINLDVEIGMFHNANIQNGLNPGMLVNFNNGETDEATQKKIEAKVKQKWQGSGKAGKAILSFNSSKESAATIETIAVSNLDKQYTFLTEQTPLQIMTGHRVTSPMIFGIKTSTGLGSNSDELKSGFQLFQETVISPYQRQILDSIEDILKGANLTSVVPAFVPFSPDFDQTETTEEQEVDNANLNQSFKLSSDYPTENQMIDFVDSLAFETLEDYPEDEWKEVAHTDEVDISQLKKFVQAFAQSEADKRIKSTSTDGRMKSRLDGNSYTVRFSYKGAVASNTRDFCKNMLTTNSNRRWRIEDISKLSLRGANPLVPQKYSIFELKGLWRCQHFWAMHIMTRKVQNPDPVPTKLQVVSSDPFLSDKWSEASRVNDESDSGLHKITTEIGYKPK